MEVIIASKLGFQVGWQSHPGRVRERNEDDFLLLSAPALVPEIDALLVVADGMGGHQAGDFASDYLVSRLRELFSSPAYQKDVHYDQKHADYYAAVLKEVLEQINEELYNLASNHPELRGMGTTATVCLLLGDRLFVGHVGDSRAYLLHEGALRQLTEDHSWVADQVRDGKLTWAEAAVHPRKNVLTRSLGSSLVVRVDRAIYPLQAGDRLLMCSDGLTNHVTDAELQHTLATQADAQVACDWLVALANQRGGSDNITAVIAHFSPDIPVASFAVQRSTTSGVLAEVAETLTTQKLARPKAKRRLLSTAGARRLQRSILVLLLSIGLGMGVFFLMPSLIQFTQKLNLSQTGAAALLTAGGAAGLFLIGVILGVLLANQWSTSGDASAEPGLPSPPEAAPRS